MLQVVVIDRTAKGRDRISKQISSYLQSEIPGIEIVPKISLNVLSPEETRFNPEPEVCILGSDLAFKKPEEVRDIKSQWPNTSIIIQVKDFTENISQLENLARFGVDDTISEKISSGEFIGKLLILSQKRKKTKHGKLILVDSGKGGMGVTSIVAAIGESLIESQKKILVIDFDADTQDLSRYLQAKPYFNENLQKLFNQEKPVTQESIEDCLVPVWLDEPNFFCLPPVPNIDDLLGNHSNCARIMLSILEVLDQIFDVIVVDPGCLRGSILNALYRLSDQVLFLINNDPAALYPAVSKLKKVRSLLPLNVKPKILNNGSRKGGLPISLLKNEFNRASSLDNDDWLTKAIPFCKLASRWPGSKVTMYSLGSRKLRRSIFTLLTELNIKAETELNLTKSFKTIFNKQIAITPNNKLPKLPNALNLKSSKDKAPEEVIQLPDINLNNLNDDFSNLSLENIFSKNFNAAQ